ncbi:MAG: T9SS type A sorting domain-containing protein [Thermaurantimonas sp.]|uniref:T9SS type A sorting domain-containing protein n=1 Tax=Thermaurantimonas sp. TaxID=2681568 RepID=UPI00391B6CE0
MKKFYSIIFSFLGISAFGQIFAPEGLNMPGNWNGWNNPPTNTAIGGVQVTGGRVQIKTGLGTNIYQTIFNAASSGGDFTGGNYSWLFTSGPLSNPYTNKWAGVNVSMNTVQNYTYNTGPDNTVTLTNGKWYTVNFRNIGYANTQAIFMETSGQPRTITSVTTSQPLTSVYPGELTVTITLSGTPASDEYFYLRWTTNSFATSNITPFAISGTTGTATINVSPNQSIAFYIFSSSIGTISGGESSLFYDLRTIHFNNNSGLNYTFTVQPAYRTIATTGVLTYTNPSTWRGNVVPPSGARIQVEDNVELDAKHLLLTLDSIELIGSGKIDLTNTWVEFVNDAALIGTASNFITGPTTQFRFLGTGRLPANFYMNGDLIAEGNLILGSNVTVGNRLTIRTGGFISSNAPIYASGSSLRYHASSYNPGLEWSHIGTGIVGTDPGYPNNVIIGDGSNPTTVNFTNLNRAVGNQLVINSGSTFNFTNTTTPHDLVIHGSSLMADGTLNMNNSNRKIIIKGQLIIGSAGVVNLSSAIGGDIEFLDAGGGIFKASGGTLNTNGRAIFFTNNSIGVQTIQGSNFTLDYVIIDNATAGVQFGSGTESITIRKNGFISTANSSNISVAGSLILEGDATEYAKLQLCATCSISGSGTITRQTFFPAGAANTNPLSSDFNDGKNGRWYSVGFPMPGVAMNQFDGGSPAFFATANPAPIARWNPNTGDYVYPTNIATETFLPNQGYVIYMGENQHGIVTRNLSTQNLVNLTMNVTNPSPTINLGYTNSPVFTNIFGSNIDGWNLIVNPYLAPLNLQSTTVTNAVGTAYIYNPTTGNFTTYNFTDPASFNIAPLQAFWVRATSVGGTVSVLPGNQSTTINPAQAKPQISADHVWLNLSRADGSADEIRIYFRSEATDNYDVDYDSEKLKGDQSRISFFTTAGSKPLAVDSRSPILGAKQIPVYIYCGNPSVMTIELKTLGLPNGYHAWLEDHVTGQFINIENAPYTFYQPTTGTHHRFTLHIAESLIGIHETGLQRAYQIWASSETLHILMSPTAARGEFFIVDMSGKRVLEKKFTASAGQHLTFDLSMLRQGVYVLKANIEGKETTLKFVR